MSIPSRKELEARARAMMIITGQAHGKLPDKFKKTPSQIKSERGRKKLLRGGKENKDTDIPNDCTMCSDVNSCKLDLRTCTKYQSVISRCKTCGQKVRHPIIPDNIWFWCPQHVPAAGASHA
jgi:hypothetical protein